MAPTAAPSLATYQQAAQAIYQPQLQGDITLAQNTETGDIANEESLKGQVNTDYQTAIENLTNTTNSNVAKINQLYTTRLGGNFSGLQGNDLGEMFSKAGQQQETIESTRANKLAQIATTEANDENTYNATVQSLTSKYQGEEAQYAETAYDAAVKEADTEAYQQEELGLRQEEVNNSAISAENSAANKYTVSQLSSGNKAYKGPNGQTNLYQFAAGSNEGDPTGTYNTIKEQLSTGSSTDKQAYNNIVQMEKNGASQDQVISYLQKAYSYIFQ